MKLVLMAVRLDFYKAVRSPPLPKPNTHTHLIDPSSLQKQFSCEITGHMNLNYFEALKSEVSCVARRP